MAVKDIVTKLQENVALTAAVTSNTTTVGAILDTADFELGLMFTLYVADFTDGTYTLLLEESDDSGMAGAVTIPTDKLIGLLPAASAASASGSILGKVGVFSNLRFVRASVVSTGVTTGALATVISTQKAETMAI